MGFRVYGLWGRQRVRARAGCTAGLAIGPIQHPLHGFDDLPADGRERFEGPRCMTLPGSEREILQSSKPATSKTLHPVNLT